MIHLFPFPLSVFSTDSGYNQLMVVEFNQVSKNEPESLVHVATAN